MYDDTLIGVSDRRDMEVFHVYLSTFIVLSCLVMAMTIYLDTEPQRGTIEVRYIRSERFLSQELITQLSLSEHIPHDLLGTCEMTTILTSISDDRAIVFFEFD